MSVHIALQFRVAYNSAFQTPTVHPLTLHLARHFTCSPIARLTKYQKSVKRVREVNPSQTSSVPKSTTSGKRVEEADEPSSTQTGPQVAATIKPGQISFELTQPFPKQDLSSTRPVKLETPEALNPAQFGGVVPVSERGKYLYRLGRSYLSFYKSGLQNVWSNYKEYRSIKQRLGGRSITDVAKYGFPDGQQISRRDYQMYLRAKHDIMKLVPFGLIFLICGEFTPLVVVALGSTVVPATCRIPKQIANDHLKAARRWLDPGILPPNTRPEDLFKLVSNNPDRNIRSNTILEDLDIPTHKVLVARDAITTVKDEALIEAAKKSQPKKYTEAEELRSNFRLNLLEKRIAYIWGLSLSPILRTQSSLFLLAQKLWFWSRMKRRAREVLCDAILITREGGLARLDPDEVVLWAMSYNSSILAQAVIGAKNRKMPLEALRPEAFKEYFVKEFNEDVDAMLGALREIEDSPANHWLAGLVRSKEYVSIHDKPVERWRR